MCRIEDCERHELWGGLCLDHLKELLGVDQPKKRRRSKKTVDAVELEVREDAAVERTDNDK